jgi:hypothetical protein
MRIFTSIMAAEVGDAGGPLLSALSRRWPGSASACSASPPRYSQPPGIKPCGLER